MRIIQYEHTRVVALVDNQSNYDYEYILEKNHITVAVYMQQSGCFSSPYQIFLFFFFFNNPPPTKISPLPHPAPLPIYGAARRRKAERGEHELQARLHGTLWFSQSRATVAMS